jgi:glucose/arabinose dehydrogenase
MEIRAPLPLCRGPNKQAGIEMGGGMRKRFGLALLFLCAGWEAAQAQWKASAAFPNLGFTNPVALLEAPRNGLLYVVEQDGRIYAFNNSPTVTEKTLVLDISAHTQGGFGLEDCGLLGIAFHPDFGKQGSPNRGYVYVWYNYADKPVLPTSPTVKIPDSSPTSDRLSRFTVPDGSLKFDPASELVLMDQKDKSTWHQGGGMFFHPKDGFLYFTNGDEGCNCGNTQIMNKSLFSGVFRIDVDMRGGNISHAIKRQPVDGKTANYFIPNDNPFVGQDVLEEFWALGLRSPHRMTYDAETGLTFIGDVGAGYSEEVDMVSKAANFQWNKEEGNPVNAKPNGVPGTWTGPITQYIHSGGAAIIGGYVYRGCANQASLGGKYLFADFVSNKVSAMRFTVGADGAAVKQGIEDIMTLPFPGDHGKNGVTSFGTDSRNELYILLLGKDTKIQKLTNPATGAACPVTVAQDAVRERAPFDLRSDDRGLELSAEQGNYKITVAALDGKTLASGSLPGRFRYASGRSVGAEVVLLRVEGAGSTWTRRVLLSGSGSASRLQSMPSATRGAP